MFSILIIACSLALDALSVSVAGGIKQQKAKQRDALKVAALFGIFQGGMPLIGYLVGQSFSGVIHQYSNWIAFLLLTAIGLKMIQESLRDNKQKESMNILAPKTLVLLAIATSIDALVVGFTLAYIDLPLLISAAVIGIVTFILSYAGFLFGKKLGSFFEGKVEILGGIALIAIGIKLLLA